MKRVEFYGPLTFCLGLVLLLTRNWIFHCILTSVFVLKPNTEVTENWRLFPEPIYLDFYFFNWTNPEEIHDLTKKPKFEEIGPYRFREHKEKVNITWNSNNTVTYNTLRYWYFEEEHSIGKATDEITTLNVVAMSVANQAKTWNYFMKKSFSISLAALAPEIHITKSVNQLIFEGYPDGYLDLGAAFPFLAEALPPFDKFAWFYTRNGSYTFDGTYNIATGVNDGKTGETMNWNYYNETPYFKGSCNKVRGSGVELYGHYRKRDSIGFFCSEICRYLPLDYEEDVTESYMPAYKYSVQAGLLDNGTLLPENKCYCNGECLPSGMLNISSCRYGSPTFVSLPHFYGADPVYLTNLEGLKPEKSKHEMYIKLEPITGVPLDITVRVQVNVRLFPVEYITLYEDVPKMIFPIFWFHQSFTPQKKSIFLIWTFLWSPVFIAVFASILMLIGAFITLYTNRSKILTVFYKAEPKIQLVPSQKVAVNSQVEKPSQLATERRPNSMELFFRK